METRWSLAQAISLVAAVLLASTIIAVNAFRYTPHPGPRVGNAAWAPIVLDRWTGCLEITVIVPRAALDTRLDPELWPDTLVGATLRFCPERGATW